MIGRCLTWMERFFPHLRPDNSVAGTALVHLWRLAFLGSLCCVWCARHQELHRNILLFVIALAAVESGVTVLGGTVEDE